MGSTIDAYKNAKKLDPTIPEVYCNLAYNYGLIGDTQKEISEYEEALRLKPDYIKALHSLAICYVESDLDDKAKVLLEQLASLQPQIYSANAEQMVHEIKRELVRSK